LARVGLLEDIGACVAKLLFFTNLVEKVGGIFESAGITPDGVWNHNSCATADNGYLSTGGLVARSNTLSRFHLPPRRGSC
jgi:hypothetical protein